MKRLVIFVSVLLLLSACRPVEEKNKETAIDSRLYEDTYFPSQRDNLIELMKDLDKYDLNLTSKTAVFGFELDEGEFLVMETSTWLNKEKRDDIFENTRKHLMIKYFSFQ